MGLTIEKTVRSDHMDVLKNIVSICCQNDSKKYSFFYEEDDSYLFGHPGFFILQMIAIIYLDLFVFLESTGKTLTYVVLFCLPIVTTEFSIINCC